MARLLPCLVLFTFFAGCMSAEERTAYAVKTLKELGAIVELNSAGEAIAVNCSESKITDDHISLLHDLPKLRRLNISDTSVSDAGLKELRSLTHLESLFIFRIAASAMAVDKLKRALLDTNVAGP